MAAWKQSWNGKTWQQMPGATPDDKKMNFFLFRRGKLTLEDVETDEKGRSGIQRNRMHSRSLSIARGIRLANLARQEAREDGEWHAPPPTITGMGEGRRRRAEGGRKEDASNHQHHYSEMLPSLKGRKPNAITPRQLRLRERYMALAQEEGRGFSVRFARHLRYKTRSNFRHLVQGTRGLGDEVMDLIEKGLESWPKAEGGRRKAEGGRMEDVVARQMKRSEALSKLCDNLSVPADLLDAPVPGCPGALLQELAAACARLQRATTEVLRLATACAASP